MTDNRRKTLLFMAGGNGWFPQDENQPSELYFKTQGLTMKRTFALINNTVYFSA